LKEKGGGRNNDGIKKQLKKQLEQWERGLKQNRIVRWEICASSLTPCYRGASRKDQKLTSKRSRKTTIIGGMEKRSRPKQEAANNWKNLKGIGKK